LHHPWLAAIRSEATHFPLGAPQAWLVIDGPTDAVMLVASLAHDLTLLALSLATPVLLASTVISTAFAMLGAGPPGAAPLAHAAESFLRPAFALVALAAAWATYPLEFARLAP
jgi:hypothetical protein